MLHEQPELLLRSADPTDLACGRSLAGFGHSQFGLLGGEDEASKGGGNIRIDSAEWDGTRIAIKATHFATFPHPAGDHEAWREAAFDLITVRGYKWTLDEDGFSIESPTEFTVPFEGGSGAFFDATEAAINALMDDGERFRWTAKDIRAALDRMEDFTEDDETA